MPEALRRRDTLALISLLIAGGSATLWLRGRAPLGRDVSRSAAAGEMLRDRSWPMSGAAQADLFVVVFSDYRCPVCRRTEPDLNEAVRADGRVRVIWRDWPVLGAASLDAARVALGAHYQEKYGAVHSALMAEPRTLDASVARAAAGRAGASLAQLDADLLRHADAIDAALARTGRDALALGVPGTPGYLVGGLLVIGGLTKAQFARAFAQARALGGAPGAAA